MLAKDEVSKVVYDDLRYLREEWTQDISDNSIRVTSAILRRLLVDGELQRAWKASGFERQPIVMAPSLAPVLEAVERKIIRVVLAGGATVGGISVQRFVATKRPLAPDESRACDRLTEDALPLKAFMDAPCVIVEDLDVSRRALVKYVANKRGGVHLDRKRPDDSEGRVHRRLDALDEGHLSSSLEVVEMVRHTVIYFELLSCGQALLRSPDIRDLSEKLAAAHNR